MAATPFFVEEMRGVAIGARRAGRDDAGTLFCGAFWGVGMVRRGVAGASGARRSVRGTDRSLRKEVVVLALKLRLTVFMIQDSVLQTW